VELSTAAVTGDRIRVLLAGHVQTSGFRPRVAPGMVVVDRQRVERAEADIGAVDDWVIAHGGYLGSDPDYRDHTAGSHIGGIRTGAAYYAVPAGALQ
jgi:hypothetical protein